MLQIREPKDLKTLALELWFAGLAYFAVLSAS
jgi:hypothetical protein